MTNHSDEHDSLVDRLSEEFTARCREGELPSIEEYACKHPEVADKIRSVFPSIAMMENLGRKQNSEARTAQHIAAGAKLPFEKLGDFNIVREIGRGGMGVVFEAVQESLDRNVAVKVLSRQAMLEQKHIRRFEREAKTASRLHHSNIVPVFGVGEVDGYNYIVMQLIDGIGIDQMIRRYRQYRSDHASDDCEDIFEYTQRILTAREQKVPSVEMTPTIRDISTHADATGSIGGPSGAEEFTNQLEPHHFECVARLAQQVAEAMAYAHEQGILHRDIKPGNLLLDKEGVAWIADFGLAKAFEQDDVTRTNDIVGTVRYMAPEQIHSDATQASDVYSFGLTLYELLTLQQVFGDSSLASFRSITQRNMIRRPRLFQKQLPVDLETIVLKCCESDPKARYQTARAVATDLESFLKDEPIQARPWTRLELFSRWCRNNPMVAGLSAVSLALLATVATVGSIGYVTTSAALEREQQARGAVIEEKDNAEKNLKIAVDALTRVYEWFAPKSLGFATAFEDDNDEQVEVNFRSQVSPETLSLLEELLTFFDQFAIKYRDREDLRLAVAKANLRIGDIRELIGEFQTAEAAYSRAATTYEYYLKKSEKGPDEKINLANIYAKIGAVRRQIDSDGEQHDADFDKAKALLAPWISNEDLSSDRLLEAANIYYRIGKAQMPSSVLPRPGTDPMRHGIEAFSSHSADKHRKSRTNRNLDKAIELLNRVDEKSDTRDYLLALSLRDQPIDLDNALEKSAELLNSLVETDPKNPDYLYALSRTYDRFTLREGNREEVEDYLRKSVALTQQLVDEHSSAYEYAIAHVTNQFKLAVSIHKKGPPRTARPWQGPPRLGDRPPARREDSNGEHDFADRRQPGRFGEPGRPDSPPFRIGSAEREALDLLQNSIELQEKLVGRFPENGELEELLKRLKTARQRIRRRINRGRPLSDLPPGRRGR